MMLRNIRYRSFASRCRRRGRNDVPACHSRAREHGKLVSISELVTVKQADWDGSIYHKALLPVVYVTGDESSEVDSPLYGMFDVVGQVLENKIAGFSLEQFFFNQPKTQVCSRSSGMANGRLLSKLSRYGSGLSAGLVLIYLLVLGQFRSYLSADHHGADSADRDRRDAGHALLGAQFTATSMIGMILSRVSLFEIPSAGGLSTVGGTRHGTGKSRRSCLRRSRRTDCVDRNCGHAGCVLHLDDPIFNGLAVSLIFGILVSPVLTLVVIPLLYYIKLKRASDKAVGRA